VRGAVLCSGASYYPPCCCPSPRRSPGVGAAVRRPPRSPRRQCHLRHRHRHRQCAAAAEPRR